MTATHGIDQAKREEESIGFNHNEHYGPKSKERTEARNLDSKRHGPHGTGHGLSKISTDDAEYIVTAKTWAVVVVRTPPL